MLPTTPGSALCSTASATRGIVEAVTPGIPQADAPDLRARRHRNAAHERIVGRHGVPDRIRVGNRHVDAQHLAEQLLRILRAVAGIAARSAVAGADVEP